MGTHQVALAFTVDSVAEGAEGIHLIGSSVDPEVIQHDILHLAIAETLIGETDTFPDQMEIFVEHGLEAAIFTV